MENAWAARANARGGASGSQRGRARNPRAGAIAVDEGARRPQEQELPSTTVGLAQSTPTMSSTAQPSSSASTTSTSNVWEARRRLQAMSNQQVTQSAAVSNGTTRQEVGSVGNNASAPREAIAPTASASVREAPKIVQATGMGDSANVSASGAAVVEQSSKAKSPPKSENVWKQRMETLSLDEKKETVTIKAGDTKQCASNSSVSPAPASRAASKDALSVVKEINPKLVMIGNVAMDPNKVRPLRSNKVAKNLHTVPITVAANHFPVKFKDVPETVYHYDVVITPKEMKERGGAVVHDAVETTVPDRLLHVIWRTFEERFHKQLGARIPFDGKKNCYTARKLNLGNNNAWVDEIRMVDPDDDDKQRTYRIQLKLANEVQTAAMYTYLKSCHTKTICELPQEVIQALDVALRYCPSINYTPCNRSFYSEKGPHQLSDILELWFGHNQSLLLGRDERAFLNVDMANKAFMKRLPLERVIKIQLRKQDQDLPLSKWKPIHYRDAENFLKGKLIEYGTGKCVNGQYEKKHRFTAVKVVEHSSATYTFPRHDGRSTTIQEYFEKEKGIKLQHPDWPVVHIGNRNMTNYAPLELCYIVPQAYKGKLEAQDTSEMIKGAAKPPQDRFKRIQTSRDNCNFEKCPILEEFGVEVGPRNIQISSALRLPKPIMVFKNDGGNKETLAPKGSDGKFQIGQFLEGAEIPKIGVLNVCGKLQENFRDTLKKELLVKLGKEALRLGMTSKGTGRGREPVDRLFVNAEIINVKARIIRGGNDSEQPFHQATRTALMQLKSNGCELVLVIIGKDGNEYATVKNEAEVQVGILTQCIKDTTVVKITKGLGAKQVMINVLLKINAKLGGVNFKLGGKDWIERFEFEKHPVLILGADVTHPAPHSKSPSVAAITASYDLSGVCFQMHIQVQEAAEEVISGIQDTIVNMLRTYKIKTGKQPQRIIMFRDGVSEGQFSTIKEKEYNGIVEACKKLNSNYSPKITFLVVKKRHHTRFLPTTQKDSVPPKGNIQPGTVVDTVITHPTEREFFLNSHVGIQGTSKPTRYHVLHDDWDFAMGDIEMLTYSLCYTFVRCTQPVSYPAPTYYAHLAAFRARALLEKEGDNADLRVLQERMKIHPELASKYPMYFV